MSVVLTTTEQICKSPLNTSPSKQLFSFSKATRFSEKANRVQYIFVEINSCSCDNFYHLPGSHNERATSFGYGNRFKPAHRNVSPPPNTYSLPSKFQDNKKGQVYTFGTSRAAYYKVYPMINPIKDAGVPGPGSYDVRQDPGKTALKYTLRPKTTHLRELLSGKCHPNRSFAT